MCYTRMRYALLYRYVSVLVLSVSVLVLSVSVLVLSVSGLVLSVSGLVLSVSGLVLRVLVLVLSASGLVLSVSMCCSPVDGEEWRGLGGSLSEEYDNSGCWKLAEDSTVERSNRDSVSGPRTPLLLTRTQITQSFSVSA